MELLYPSRPTEHSNTNNNPGQNKMGGVMGSRPGVEPIGRGRGAWGNQNSYERDSDIGYGNKGGHGGFYNPVENNYGMGNRSQSAPVSNDQEGTGSELFFPLIYL